MKSDHYIFAALITSCILIAALLGKNLGDRNHANDYDLGYNAGWQERQKMADADNDRLRDIGLCPYANLICKVKK
jgi:hypothetical protein